MDLDGLHLDLGDFDLDIAMGEDNGTRHVKPKRYKEMKEAYVKYSHAQSLVEDMCVEKGFRLFAIVNGSFVFGDLIEALIFKYKWHVKELTISTLSMNENNIDSLGNLLHAGVVDELNVIVSDYFYSHERWNLVRYMYEELDMPSAAHPDGAFQLAVAGTHCKTATIETHCGLKIVMHGSANLRSSGNIEQFMIEENEELHDFNNEYQYSIIEKYKTINKAVRSGALWDAVTLKNRKNG